jgi:hypothetical protein
MCLSDTLFNQSLDYSESNFYASDPGPSRYRAHGSSFGTTSHGRGDFEEVDESQHHNYIHDFSSEDYHGQRTNLGRRNSVFVLVGRAPSDVPPVPRLPRVIPDDEFMSDTYEEEAEEDAENFINYSLLSHLAMLLHDKVPRDEHTKESIPHPNAFTGKDIVVRTFRNV